MEKIQETQIAFNVGNERKEFKVYHNLFDYGLDIESAFNIWVNKTEVYTDESFCEYLLSKRVGYVALTEKAYKILIGNESSTGKIL